MFEIREIETIEAPKKKSLEQEAISAATWWLFAIWTCACFGC